MNLIKTNWKACIIAMLILTIAFQHLTYNSRYKTCKAETATAQSQLSTFKAAAWKQESILQAKLRREEYVAAKAHAESKVRIDKIMEENVPEDCNQAKEWTINNLKFVWSNNIP